jgi:hypothetical protein
MKHLASLIRNTDKFALFFTALYVVIALFLCIAVVRADDHMIRPTCWEENHNGEVQRRVAAGSRDTAASDTAMARTDCAVSITWPKGPAK